MKRTLADRKNNGQEEAYVGDADRQEDDKGEVDSSDAYWTVDSDGHSTEDAAGTDRKHDTNEGVDQKVDDKVEADANDAAWKENADSTASKADGDLYYPKEDVEVEAEGGVRVRDVRCIILSTIIRPIYSFSLLLSWQNFTEVKNWIWPKAIEGGESKSEVDSNQLILCLVEKSPVKINCLFSFS